jgi:hypothetical protein
MSWTQTKNIAPFLSPTPLRPKSMLYDEFSAGNRGLLKHPAKVISRPCLSAAPGADASAIHGRLSAQVALLQSPTLPAAKSGCSQKREFRNVPIDKPHTRIPRFLALLENPRRARVCRIIAVQSALLLLAELVSDLAYPGRLLYWRSAPGCRGGVRLRWPG